MVSASELGFFFVLFVQSLVILAYGLLLRSRSLVITPIAFAVLGVATVVYSALKGLSTVILIGCTGVVLLLLGIVAVILRERITKFGEQLSDWKP
jgi:exosortase/archaeosortase